MCQKDICTEGARVIIVEVPSLEGKKSASANEMAGFFQNLPISLLVLYVASSTCLAFERKKIVDCVLDFHESKKYDTSWVVEEKKSAPVFFGLCYPKADG